MFSSVLVANRGEIACRIFRTARRMGLRTIAVYSDVDAQAKHAREADVSVRIGPAPARESYLVGEAILAAAKKTGAEAIHPGYGFLSENPDFAEAVISAGLIWIGPTPAAIRAMGLKDESKRIAIAAGVPVLAGYQGEDQSEKRLAKAAKEIGFPVLIKAVAGGGGRGIREVRSADEFKTQLESAQREAKAAFGNDVVLIEKLVERPRHIEVQVFGDSHGEVVHLFERDCSLQRRRQKVIEEAPAPGMTEEVRTRMTDAAVKLARAVEYQNAGTVEFIVVGTGPLRADGFWFLEMNTRLQVEHPVTEEVTGLDLVEWQLRVAAGERLPLRQSEIKMGGHAIEVRICAEDPSENFRPSVGRLVRCRWPLEQDAAGEKIRLDCGFEQGDAIPSAYDSMIGKLIVRARSDHARTTAIQVLRRALGDFEALGVTTNAHFLLQCLAPEGAFAAGDHHVGTVGADMDVLTDPAASLRRAACLLVRSEIEAASGDGPWSAMDGWRLNAAARARWTLETGQGQLVIDRVGDHLTIEDRSLALPSAEAARGKVHRHGGTNVVFADGGAFAFAPAGASADQADAAASDDVKAPLPGKIVSVSAVVGAHVKKGDPLVVLEAMKMEHTLGAPRDGAIAEVLVQTGVQTGEGAVLVRLSPVEA